MSACPKLLGVALLHNEKEIVYISIPKYDIRVNMVVWENVRARLFFLIKWEGVGMRGEGEEIRKYELVVTQ